MAISDNAQIYYANASDNAALTATSSAVSTAGVALGPANLQDYRPGIVWRGTGLAVESIAGDLGANPDPVNGFFMVNHNHDNSGQFRLRGATNAGLVAPGYDSGWASTWPSLYGAGEGGAGMGGAGGVPLLTSFNQFRPFAFLLLPQAYNLRYWQLDLKCPGTPGGAPITYQQFGRLFLGSAIQVQRNFDLGWSMRWRDQSSAIRTNSGSLRFNRRGKWRELSLSFAAIPQDEAMAVWDDFGRIVAESRDFFIVLKPTASLATIYRTSLYCACSQNGELSQQSFPWFKKPIVAGEIT